MAQQTLQELEALRARLQADVNRSRQADNFGLSKNSPLVQNLNRVNEQINKQKQGK